MFADENKAIVRRFFDAFEANDRSALTEILDPGLRAYLPGEAGPLSREAFVDVVGAWSAAFDELSFMIESQVAEGDTVANRLTLAGVHSRGDFAGVPPSGNPIAIAVMTFERVHDGRIAERWVVLDVADLLQQLTNPHAGTANA